MPCGVCNGRLSTITEIGSHEDFHAVPDDLYTTRRLYDAADHNQSRRIYCMP